MKIVLIRHGEPDYTEVRQRKFMGHGLDLAHLTDAGKEQAKKVAADPALDGIELIVSSSYTRALHTASIISRVKDIPIEIELDLHEWLPDLTFTYMTDVFAINAVKALTANKGIRPPYSEIKYEELSAVFDRANACLKKYLKYEKIAAVSHGMLIRQFQYAKQIPYCGITEIDYDDSFKWKGFIEQE